MANRYRQSTRAKSGDWKFEVRDRPANWPRADPFPTVSDLHGRKGRRNAGLCAGHDEVSDFRECVAGAEEDQPSPPEALESWG
jgi:hypothetical protein